MIQAVLDVQDVLAEVNSSFDPDNAIGVILDQRVAINGIQREGGTYTVTPVTIVTTQSVNLYGLDQSVQPVYTVQDQAGNQWQLQTTQIGVLAGAHVFNFQAATPGAVTTTLLTITIPVTIVLGVSSISNPSTYSYLGVNEESDAALKIRRQMSVANGSQGYLVGLLGVLGNISGVTYSAVFENDTDATDVEGVPGHSIWVIVAGSGAPSAIANAIYTKRNAGCGMYGQQTYTITQIDGSPFVVRWDNVTTQNVFIAFTVTSINGVNAPNIAGILAALPTSLALGVNTEINVNEVATAVQQADSNTLVTNAGVTLANLQTLTLSGVAASGSFKILYAGNESAAINWNDPIATITAKIAATVGLTGSVTTGSIASQTLAMNLGALVGGVQGLISVVSNSLQTSAPAPVTFTFNEGYGNILYPSNNNYQLTVSAGNIVILPMQLSPATISVVHLTTQQFTPLGGYGPYAYTLTVNNSGGSINATTGIYTAGSTTGVQDTVQVTDTFGNTATALVTVT
jgi:hypothetical protein